MGIEDRRGLSRSYVAYFLVRPVRFPAFFARLLFLVDFAFGVGIGSGVAVGCAPRILTLPSLRVSVMIGLAAGRNLCSFEYRLA